MSTLKQTLSIDGTGVKNQGQPYRSELWRAFFRMKKRSPIPFMFSRGTDWTVFYGSAVNRFFESVFI